MLDFTSAPADETVTRYSSADPFQTAFRARLAQMTEAEINGIERDIGLYQRMGYMPRRLAGLLDTTPAALAA